MACKLVCKNCGKYFESRGPRTLFCDKPECQEARKQRKREQNRLSHQQWKKENQDKYRKHRKKWAKVFKGKIYHTNTNWSKHHQGKCEVCGKHRWLNRFDRCLQCYKSQSAQIAGDEWSEWWG